MSYQVTAADAVSSVRYGVTGNTDIPIGNRPVIDSDGTVTWTPGEEHGGNRYYIYFTASDSSGNGAQQRLRIQVTDTDIPAPSSILHDTFDDMTGWTTYNDKSDACPRSFADYAVSIQNVGTDKVLLISGDGFVSQSGVRRDIDVSSITAGPLEMSVDWRAKSDTGASAVTNANISVENSTHVPHHVSLARGGTHDSG